MIEIDQFIPSLVARDAQGAHVTHVRRTLQSMGIVSEIYAMAIDPGIGVDAHPYRSFARVPHQPRTWLMYQLSTGSTIVPWLLARPEPKIVNYHNITPGHLLAPWAPAVGLEVAAGRSQMARLAVVTELAIAVSSYNEKELIEAGYRSTTVVPLFTDLGGAERLGHGEAATSGEVRTARGGRWLFVGRIVPNKCQHDLVAALAVYRRLYDPHADLTLVGKPTLASYDDALRTYTAELGLTSAVHFAGSVSPEILAAHYRAADVVVCLSEHEGFCVPLLEAMLLGIPIVALAAGAIPETLGGSGLVLDDKSPSTVAAAVHRVMSDSLLRDRMVERGRARAAEFSVDRTAERLKEVIGGLVGATG